MTKTIEDILQTTPEEIYVIRNRQRAFTGKIFSVDTFTLDLPDKTSVKYEVVNHHGGAGVMALLGSKLCVVRQYRPQVGRMTLEIPAGRIDEGEDAKDAAKRELLEETGYVAKSLEFVAKTFGSVGWTDEATAIYFAEDLQKAERHLGEGELVDVYWIEVSELLSAVRAGLIQDNKTVISILDAAKRLSLAG